MSIMRVCVAALFLLVIGRPVQAARMALDPMNRLHAGLSIASPSSMGVMMGMDSRLTQIIYVDVTGFIDRAAPVNDGAVPNDRKLAKIPAASSPALANWPS